MTQKYKQFAVDEEIDAAYNEAATLVDATHKDIQVLIDIYEPCVEREAKNEVSDDTIETLSVSEVDAGGEVFGDAAGTSKVEVTTWISAGANYQVWRPRPNPMEPRGVQLDLKNGGAHLSF